MTTTRTSSSARRPLSLGRRAAIALTVGAGMALAPLPALAAPAATSVAVLSALGRRPHGGRAGRRRHRPGSARQALRVRRRRPETASTSAGASPSTPTGLRGSACRTPRGRSRARTRASRWDGPSCSPAIWCSSRPRPRRDLHRQQPGGARAHQPGPVVKVVNMDYMPFSAARRLADPDRRGARSLGRRSPRCAGEQGNGEMSRVPRRGMTPAARPAPGTGALRRSMERPCASGRAYCRLTVTPPENAESCSSIAVGVVPAGTSNTILLFRVFPGLISSNSESEFSSRWRPRCRRRTPTFGVQQLRVVPEEAAGRVSPSCTATSTT